MVNRILEFWSFRVKDDSKRSGTDFAASCHEDLSIGCQPRNGADSERWGMLGNFLVSPPVLAP